MIGWLDHFCKDSIRKFKTKAHGDTETVPIVVEYLKKKKRNSIGDILKRLT